MNNELLYAHIKMYIGDDIDLLSSIYKTTFSASEIFKLATKIMEKPEVIKIFEDSKEGRIIGWDQNLLPYIIDCMAREYDKKLHRRTK